MDSIRARRSKNISEKLRVVSEGDKKEAAKARLDALENDDAVPMEDPAAGSDEEFELEDSEEEGGRHHIHLSLITKARSLRSLLTYP